MEVLASLQYFVRAEEAEVWHFGGEAGHILVLRMAKLTVVEVSMSELDELACFKWMLDGDSKKMLQKLIEDKTTDLEREEKEQDNEGDAEAKGVAP
eukprot:2036429-Lingulodinium_polyedra.AAC.1